MKTIVFDHQVEKSREGTYYTIPFQVPEDVEKITVTYTYPKETGDMKNVIDFGLEDCQEQFLGWSGSSRRTISVGEFDGTPGYLMQPIRAGEWKIIVGAYHVGGEGITVHYEIQFQKKEYRWLYGDLHMHSDASDGEHSIPVLAQRAKKQGLDFIAVTNHNNYVENYYLPKVPGLTLIPGVEWTHYKGHMNFLGIQKPFTGSFVANDLAAMQRITKEARERHALVSVNHPKYPDCPYLWEDENSFQLMEIWNGPMWKANKEAISWWHQLLVQGRRIPAIGGSDYHRDHEIARMGHPVTAIYTRSSSVEDLMEAIGKGHCYVVHKLQSVRLQMECQGKIFGDVVEDGKTVHELAIQAEQLPGGSVVQVIGENGVLESYPGRQGRVNVDIQVKDTRFVYLQVVRKILGNKETILAVSNPIYFV